MTPFTLTDSAKTQMEYLLSKNPDKDAVHLAVKGGGCAGFKYEWGFIKNDEIEKTDTVYFILQVLRLTGRKKHLDHTLKYLIPMPLRVVDVERVLVLRCQLHL